MSQDEQPETPDGTPDGTFVGTDQSDTVTGDDGNNDMFGRRGDDFLSGAGGEDRIHGETGEDNLSGDDGSDLVAGGGAGAEWQLVDGEWVYDAAQIKPLTPEELAALKLDGSDDVVRGGAGNDVLLGNAGDDILVGDLGNDRLNGGSGDDQAFGGTGDDILNLDRGDDVGVGGLGADVLNGGKGDDILVGDLLGGNLLESTTTGSTSFAQYARDGDWKIEENEDGNPNSMSQSVATEDGKTYELTFEVAANLAGGHACGKVEVLWNGEVVGEIETASGVFERHTIEVGGDGSEGDLTFRSVDPEPTDTGPQINMDGPIFSYDKTIDVGGEEITAAAFAPGQAKLYQVISGQLKVFDPATNEYADAGDPAGYKINSIGFNIEDDLIYGIAKGNGTDSLGNPVKVSDLIVLDANGEVYRMGETPVTDYVGDFDEEGNLWTFQGSVNRITKIDVDNLDADGNPVYQHFNVPNELIDSNVHDVAYNAKENAFYTIQAPKTAGEAGTFYKIDMNTIDATGTPGVEAIPISGTLVDGVMNAGMVKGAYGAVFLDGDGNLYAGLNQGDHDFDDTTGGSGGIYKINVDFERGTAYAELKSDAQATSSNDGAVDPRSMDAFAEVDTEASILIREPALVSNEGGNDKLRGGEGNDDLHGNYGDDKLWGGTGDDMLFGDQGDDKLFGGSGNDKLYGGDGDDILIAGAGGDVLDGGSGNDLLKGSGDSETMYGGIGDDRIFAKAGDDVVDGGEGNDRIFSGAGNDSVDGGDGRDLIEGGGGNDVIDGGSGNDRVLGGAGNDDLTGGAGNDKIVGGAGSDRLEGGAGADHLWGGAWQADGSADTFAYSKGGGRDIIHDFEAEKDQIDLSSYGLEYGDIVERISDFGWATEIDLTGLEQAGDNDRILLKSINPDDLDESNFIT